MADMVGREGYYIVIEGTDGTGKSTQAERLKTRLGRAGVRCLADEIHEPGGVPIASRIREVIKDGSLKRDAMTNLLLFNAARRANWLQVMRPALESGFSVVTARNYLSTLAVQGQAEGLAWDDILAAVASATDSRYMQPDLTIVLHMTNEAERTLRISSRGEPERPDTFESRDAAFQNSIKQGYLRAAEMFGYPVVAADGDRQAVEEVIWREVQRGLGISALA